ncbi:hypothetical protein T439DRAFT_158002 [Meredithblackwellia eburnea MCA 4105]
MERHAYNPWMRIQFGDKNKCISAAWGGGFDIAGVMYQCSVGTDPIKSYLEPTKQWWTFVDIRKPYGKKAASVSQLVAYQNLAVKTRAAGVAAGKTSRQRRSLEDESVDVDSDLSLYEELTPEEIEELGLQMFGDDQYEEDDSLMPREVGSRGQSLVRRKALSKAAQLKARRAAATRKKALAKKRAIAKAKAKAKARAVLIAKKKRAAAQAAASKKIIGTYYIIPIDHLLDQATRALASSTVKLSDNKVVSTRLNAFKIGDKSQQWVLSRA